MAQNMLNGPVRDDEHGRRRGFRLTNLGEFYTFPNGDSPELFCTVC